MSEIKMPLTNVQQELLKVFSCNMRDEELIELKREIGKFFLRKAVKKADKVGDEKGYSDEMMDNWLKEKS